MTKRLEELFNLSDDNEQQDISPSNPPSVEETEQLTSAMNQIDKIDRALPAVKDLQANDKEIDELAADARDSYQTLMDLGMNVDPRFSGKLFEVASQMLGHAISAKNSKIEKKLKMVELQIKKARLDQQEQKNQDSQDSESSSGMVIDRNELLAQIIAQNNNNKNDN